MAEEEPEVRNSNQPRVSILHVAAVYDEALKQTSMSPSLTSKESLKQRERGDENDEEGKVADF